jgi:hypothetical protein
MRRLWRDYSLSIVLAVLFLAAWVGQALFQWPEYVRDQHDHGQAADTVGFLVTFGRATLENWQSEWLQLLTFVLLTSVFIHRGSHESKDSADDETHARLVRIEAKIDVLTERDL